MKHRVDQLLRTRPDRVHWLRYVISIGLGLVLILLLPSSMTLASRVAIGWCGAAACQIALIVFVMQRWSALSLHDRIVAASIGQLGFALLLVIGAGVSVTATIWVLRVAHSQGPLSETLHLILGGGTVLLTWFTIQCIFAVRYAHLYYEEASDGQERGLAFPGGQEPDYSDFLYFAICAGMTFQVSDVATVSRIFRKWVTFHGVLSFLFSTINLALLVDIAANLVGS
ncbi:DUF1345 domain-containing protein [Amorphus sp. 3PC139-8]|uniref:DUF1345 domain-containing protein n=1 Tax=Amorphus sp. 3PC139-8 TaxID=2735676 RepID=UPI00345D74AB